MAPLKLIGTRHILEVQPKDAQQVNAEMRMCFDSGISLPLEKRRLELKNILRFFEECEKEIHAALEHDLGKPEFEAHLYDVHFPIHECKYMLKNLNRLTSPQTKGFSVLTFPSTNQLYREPLGVCLIIGTWNFPIQLSLVPVIGAIAAGNCVVLKPCNVASATSKLLNERFAQFVDPRVCTVVGGHCDGDRQMTAALLEHKWDHVFFTGSPSVGRVVYEAAARHLTPCTLELGGKNPVLVDQNCDIDATAKRIILGRMINAGQQCIAPDYCLVEKSVCNALEERMKSYVEKFFADQTDDESQSMARIVGDKQMTRLVGLLKTHGGKVVIGGDYDEATRYISPTIVHVDDWNSSLLQEETFGPILVVKPVKSMEEAIEYVNTKPKSLALYVFSNDHNTQEKILYNTSSGGVTVNGTLMHAGHPELGFGGVGESGMGRYHGDFSFMTFTHEKPVLRKAIWHDAGLLSDPFFLYPPWTALKLKFLRMVLK